MALTGAKPFLKNISKEIHSKALADNTRTILSLKTESKVHVAITQTEVQAEWQRVRLFKCFTSTQEFLVFLAGEWRRGGSEEVET